MSAVVPGSHTALLSSGGDCWVGQGRGTHTVSVSVDDCDADENRCVDVLKVRVARPCAGDVRTSSKHQNQLMVEAWAVSAHVRL